MCVCGCVCCQWEMHVNRCPGAIRVLLEIYDASDRTAADADDEQEVHTHTFTHMLSLMYIALSLSLSVCLCVCVCVCVAQARPLAQLSPPVADAAPVFVVNPETVEGSVCLSVCLHTHTHTHGERERERGAPG